MQNISLFQRQFPLDHRKFWKKMVEKILSLIVLAIVVAVVVGLIVAIIAAATNKASGMSDGTIIIGAIIFFAFTLFLTFLAYGLYVKEYIKRYYYDANENFITIKKNVFTPTEIHIQYQKIQDVYVDQDLLDRLFGIYDVHIASATASSGIEAHIDGVSSNTAEGLKNFILEKIKNSGYGSSTATANTPLNNSVARAEIRANLNEDVSSSTYPISNLWFVQSFFANFWASLGIILFVFVFLFGGRRNDGKIAEDIYNAFGLSSIWALLVFWLVCFVILLIVSAVWKMNYHFAFQPEFILQKEGVISRSQRHLPYKAVQDVTLKQGLIERFLGISTVVIENAAQSGSTKKGVSSNSIRIPGQERLKGEKLVEILNNIVRRSNSTGMGV